MRLTIVGCGDAFGSGGRANTCYWLDGPGGSIALDFGATSLVELKRRGLGHDRLDAIVLSHLHGDHFGGLPFLLLESQFVVGRTRPLTILGPPGTTARVKAASDVFFPGCSQIPWSFPLRIVDLPCGEPTTLDGGIAIETREVIHPSGGPPTAVRLSWGGRVLAFSGDTSWTDALIEVAAGANLFIVECYMPDGDPVAHGTMATIDANRDRLGAERIMLTHMGDAMLRRMDEARARGFLVAHDGLVIDV